MRKVEEIEHDIEKLSINELKSFRRWFIEFDADAWDKQITGDVESGKLDEFADQALNDYQTGRASEL
ncbi:MAG: hypothetical protein ACC707_15965 [Thiohalomonadales bacterium]